MIEFYSSFNFNSMQWIQVVFCAIGIGMAKTGLSGIGLLVVPIMASLFGMKSSTGVLLILLILADFLGVSFYHRHANLNILIKLIPSTAIGIIIGVVIGELINEEQFGIIFIGIIFTGITLTFLPFDQKNDSNNRNIIYTTIIAFLGGLATMIGNAAGPILTIYLLYMGYEKNKFIGTAAWFFLVVNLIKLPFHIIVWKTISISVVLFDISLSPFILIGALLGVYLVKMIPEKPYKIILIISVLISIARLIDLY